MNITNRSNKYMRSLPWFDRIPKSVLAAIAVSYASSGGDYLEQASDNVAREWMVLYENGIVPQRPPADIREAAQRAEDREELCTR